MAGINLSGLASGFDWESMITQLVEAERSAEDPIYKNIDALTGKQSGLSTIKSLMDSFQKSCDALSKQTSDYYGRTTTHEGNTSTSDSNMTSTADTTTPLGEYTFNIIQKATASQIVGGQVEVTLDDTSVTLESLNITTPINFKDEDDDEEEFGTITINGAQIEIRPTDTLQEVLDQISTATNGDVTAELVDNKLVLSAAEGVDLELGSSNDTSNFWEAMKLYTTNAVTDPETGETTLSSSANLGAVSTQIVLTSAIDTAGLAVDGTGKGSFSINGVNFDYNINKDSIRSIMNLVNNSNAGVLMNYDSSTGQISITNQETGALAISLSDSTGLFDALGLTEATGMTKTYGKVAKFTVNGSTEITSNSNTLTEEVTGIPGLKVKIKDTGEDTITVNADTSAAVGKINNFISAYNALNSKISELTKSETDSKGKVTQAALAGNREVSEWQREMRLALYDQVETGLSSVSRLYHIGIETDGTSGTLSITDQDALEEALEDNPTAVAALFNHTAETSTSKVATDGDGIAGVISKYIKNLIKTDGSYDAQQDSINSQIKNLESQIATMERRIINYQSDLTNSFLRMETDQAKVQQQATLISSFFGS